MEKKKELTTSEIYNEQFIAPFFSTRMFTFSVAPYIHAGLEVADRF